MNATTVCLLSLGIAVLGNAQDRGAKSAPAQSFKAGGVPIALPSPTTQMSEVGYDNRELMEVFVPLDNRLIAAFVQNEDLSELTKGSDDLMMSKYAMIQVPRHGEYMDCDKNDFKEVIDGAKEVFGEALNSSVKEAEEEFNRRLRLLECDEAAVSLGKPLQLGCLFSKLDAYGFGMIMPVSMDGEHTKMSMGCVLLCVKQRLLFVYLYAEYKNEDTVKWLRKTTEDWADAILKANG